MRKILIVRQAVWIPRPLGCASPPLLLLTDRRPPSQVGIPCFFPPGAVEQLVYGLIIAFISAVVYSKFAPYEDKSDDMLASISQLIIFLALVCDLILSVQPENPAIRYTLLGLILAASLLALGVEDMDFMPPQLRAVAGGAASRLVAGLSRRMDHIIGTAADEQVTRASRAVASKVGGEDMAPTQKPLTVCSKLRCSLRRLSVRSGTTLQQPDGLGTRIPRKGRTDRRASAVMAGGRTAGLGTSPTTIDEPVPTTLGCDADENYGATMDIATNAGIAAKPEPIVSPRLARLQTRRSKEVGTLKRAHQTWLPPPEALPVLGTEASPKPVAPSRAEARAEARAKARAAERALRKAPWQAAKNQLADSQQPFASDMKAIAKAAVEANRRKAQLQVAKSQLAHRQEPVASDVTAVEMPGAEAVFLPMTSATASRVTERVSVLSSRDCEEAPSRASGGADRPSTSKPSPPVPVLDEVDEWGTERTFDENGLDDTNQDGGISERTAAILSASSHPSRNGVLGPDDSGCIESEPLQQVTTRKTGNAVLGADGKFGPPKRICI